MTATCTTVSHDRRAELLRALQYISPLTHTQAARCCRCPGIRHTVKRMVQDRQLEFFYNDAGRLAFRLPAGEQA